MNDGPRGFIHERKNCAVRRSFPSRNPFGLSWIIPIRQHACRCWRSTSAVQKRDGAIKSNRYILLFRVFPNHRHEETAIFSSGFGFDGL